MADQPTTRLAVSGHRFLMRRMEHALVRRNIAMHDDPLRAQSLSLVAGCVVAVIAVAACAILAFIRPQGSVGSAPIVMVRESGALYVRLDDVLHPVPNLASARIIARSAANPVVVAAAAIASSKRGPSMGIPGAPAAIGTPLAAPSWMVCDTDRTVVIVGGSVPDGLDDVRSVLVSPRGEGPATTYLLYDGRRAEVDLRNPAVVRALRLEGVAPMLVSRALLDSLPEVPAIAAPRIDGAGTAGPPSLDGVPVGAVLRVVRADATDYYAVLRDGVQRIGEVAADLIRFTYRGMDGMPTIAPSAIARTSAVDGLAVEHIPQRAREPVGAGSGAAVCVQWHADQADDRSRSAVLTGKPATADAGTTPLAQADGDGPNVDAVAAPAGRVVDARATAIVGDDGSAGPRYLVSDMGVLYGIHDDDVATHLGLSGPPAPAPWPILAALPRGPELSAEAASVARDGWVAPS
ncbi:type VII secretion protein EccB [Mycolicibacterium sp. P9-64]|nr:type VII secretion protein EccB [Mycolicibacterium sp. P9-64]KAA0075672.1 type VII secretion protein EccB [Mycolicibacterium sp. P9-64]